MTKVLVLGADDFIGRKVVADPRLAGMALPFQGALDDASIMQALSNVDAVINCTIGAPAGIVSTARVLYAAAASLGEPLRIVHLSSMTVYGSVTGVIGESSPLVDDLGPYATAQIEAEALASKCPDAVILRPGCEYGPGCPQWSERIARWLLARRLGDLGDDGEGICNLVFIDDLVTAIVQCAQRPGLSGQTFNVVSSTPTWNEYFAAFGTALGIAPVPKISKARLALETKVFAIPLKVLELVWRKAGMNAGVLPPAMPPSFLRLCRQTIRLDATHAQAVLGLDWTSLAEGSSAAAAPFRTLR